MKILSLVILKQRHRASIMKLMFFFHMSLLLSLSLSFHPHKSAFLHIFSSIKDKAQI